MKVTKSAIKKELKGLWNDTRIIKGIKVVRVCWKDKMQYMVIENDESFDDAIKDNFQPIDYFRTQDELIDKLYRVINR